ncbi:MAG: T9SS type A sorting domain-containing protein [Bacteroidales bacterium]|jgi:hypothetical protein|nr:T9SS type A sorting domain-containing protein [Bacteroidales bacterium]MDD4213348.1 T9SS type A sorting domain-containing protein [Bacteroidales bacterium]
MKKLITLVALTIFLKAGAQVCFTDTIIPMLTESRSILCNDYNNDTKLDLIITSIFGKELYLLIGDGNGNFNTANLVYYDQNGGNFSGIVSGDFNGDGNVDLAYPDYATAGYVRILSGDGTGNFTATDSFAVGDHPRIICGADFNRDGNIDISVANETDRNISVLLGNGSGYFTTNTGNHIGKNPTAMTSSDFNGDNFADLAITCNNDGGPDSVWVLIGDGTGNFGSAAKYLCGSGPYSVCSKDFNADGFDDIAVANKNSNNVSVLLSKGTSGLFYNAINYNAGTGAATSAPFSVVSADINFDGIPDLAIANYYQSIVFLLIGTGNGTFGSSTYFPAHYGPWTIITADFNGDEKPDLATTQQSSYNITVLLNCYFSDIESYDNEHDFTVYPNPSDGNFVVEISIPGKPLLQIFDITGNLMYSEYIEGKTHIRAQSLKCGIYNMNITNSEYLLNKKLIIVK